MEVHNVVGSGFGEGVCKERSLWSCNCVAFRS
jgi:hypothetical protein